MSVFVPPLRESRQLDDGVGDLVTTGIHQELGCIVLHISDGALDQDAYALLECTEAREIARYLNEMADKAEAGAL